MASLPTYNPNSSRTLTNEALFNRATLGVYEQGSTFKIFNTAMALDSGKVGLNSVFDATSPIRIDRFTINDDHAQRRPLNVAETFKFSSNIASAKMAVEDFGGKVLDRRTTDQGAFACELGGDDGRTLFVCTYDAAASASPEPKPVGTVAATRVEVPRA